jgi:hypothetical protein
MTPSSDIIIVPYFLTFTLLYLFFILCFDYLLINYYFLFFY